MYIDLSFCSYVYTQMYVLIHYFVLWPCDMAIFVQHYCYIHIYNIKQGSNLYMYIWLTWSCSSLSWILLKALNLRCTKKETLCITLTCNMYSNCKTVKLSNFCHKKTTLLSGILRIMPKCSENSIYLWIESYKESISKFHFISISISNIDCT